ncbi:MAG: CotH kinase family protein [Bacteroidales bacterium]|nr:CotH kinase family protein [Bacteroidales bacterium]
MYKILIITGGILFFHPFAISQIVINEFMAANSSVITDPDNDESADWIELFNISSNTIDLSGFYITDNLNNPDKWAIPSGTIIPGNGYLLIWADGTDTLIHASFKLSSAGEELGLFNPNLNLVDGFTFGLQETDISYGRQTDGNTTWAYFTQSTPGASNNNSFPYAGITYYETSFSLRGGFYSSPQSVELSSLGGTIHFTLDGTVPTIIDPIYTNAIALNQSTFVRARVFQNGFIPGPAITNSYFIGEDFESRGLPVVSLVTNPDYFWDPDSGIYVQSFKPEWEYPVNIEFFENDGNNRAVFNERAGVQIKGLYSWQLPQKMLGIEFRGQYGKGKLDYPLFDDRVQSTFDQFVLRVGGSDWAYTSIRDGLSQSLTQENAPVANQGFRQCIVFVNGEYMGIHNLRSSVDAGFIEENYGLESGTYDLIENDGVVAEGTNAQFLTLDGLFNSDLSIQSNFDQLASILDIENYTDYWISEIWCGNTSWGHNVVLWKPHDGGKWQFLFADFDRAFTNSTFSISQFSSPQGGSSYDYARIWMQHLFQNDDYAAYFAQRFNDHIYTTFHPNRVNEKIDEFATPIVPEIPYHVNRWSGTTSSYGNGIASVQFWEDEVQNLRSYAEERHAFMMNNLQSTFGLNTFANLGAACYPADAGQIRINEFIIPHLPWNGPYFEQMPLEFTAVPNPGYNFTGWSTIESQVLISLQETWKYNDGGLNLGTSWTAVNFDDSSWSQGQAELGYGDGDENTVVSYGSNSQDKHITTYFRKQFLYSGTPDILSAIVNIRRDDGAVIYLNGTEIARSNMPSGTIDYQTGAIEAVAGNAEDNLVEFLIEAPLLNDTNVIAVEIHQYNGQSSDISFDMTFSVQTPTTAIASTNQTLPITLTGNAGYIARFAPTGQCILPSEIKADTTLTMGCSPYLASGDIKVDSGVSLSIDPGVEIWFPENARLIIQGDLKVNGTQSQRVLFKANQDYGAESWGNLTFDNATDTSHLNYLELKDGSKGPHPIHNNAAISAWYSVVVIDHLILTSNFSNPIFAEYSDITLTNSTLHSDVTGDLINIKYGNGYISDCTFTGNDMPDTDAIDYDEVTDGVIRNSSIQGFLGFNNDGIDLGEGCENILIENCLINDCFDKGISIGQKSNALVKNTTIVDCNMGVGAKDLGEAEMDHLTFYSNVTAVAAFEKNPGMGGGTVSISNSILSNSSGTPLFVDPASTGIAENNIYDTDTLDGISNVWENPEFVNPTDYNFQLKPTSGALLAALDGQNLGTLDHSFTSTAKVLISDIQYFHPINANKEFIKLLNPGQDTIDLSGYTVSNAINFVFSDGTLIEPSEKIMLVRDMNLFLSQPGQIFQWTSGQLANEGEMILLADSNGIIVDHVSYRPAAPWPLISQADEYLMLISPELDNHFGSSWLQGVLSIETTMYAGNNLKVYPIPASDNLYFSSDEIISSIRIYDITGRLAMDEKPESSSLMLNVSTLKPGMYMTVVNGDRKVKFVKR